MGEEAFDEVIIAARRGTLFIRGGCGREEVWLGLAPDQRPEGDPDIVVELTPLMRHSSCAPPAHPAFDYDIYDCPCGHMYGDHEYHYVGRKMVIDGCVSCSELRNG